MVSHPVQITRNADRFLPGTDNKYVHCQLPALNLPQTALCNCQAGNIRQKELQSEKDKEQLIINMERARQIIQHHNKEYKYHSD